MFRSKRSGSAIGWVLAGLVVVVILFAVGWLRLGNNDGNPTVEIDKTEIEDDSQRVIDEGRELLGNEPQDPVVVEPEVDTPQ